MLFVVLVVAVGCLWYVGAVCCLVLFGVVCDCLLLFGVVCYVLFDVVFVVWCSQCAVRLFVIVC